jgi:uncharacterized protein (DUF1330 family)
LSVWISPSVRSAAIARLLIRRAGRRLVRHPGRVKVTLCVLLWARPGAEDGLIAYEDQVLDLVPGHGGRILQRARGSGADGQPLEMQLLEFPSAAALDAYLQDGRRTSLAVQRDQAVARTEVIQVQLVSPSPGQ